MSNILIILLMTAFMGCHKEDPVMTVDPPDPGEEVEVFELEWATRLNPNKEVGQLSNYRFIYDGLYIDYGDFHDPIEVYGFDTRTGEKVSEYIDQQENDSDVTRSYKYENLLIIESDRRVFCLDLSTFEKTWEINTVALDLNIDPGSVHKDKLYVPASEDFGSEMVVKKLIEIDFASGNYTFILSLPADDAGIKHVSPPVFRETSEGTIMYYNEFPNHDEPPQRSWQSIVAYNLDTEEEVWRNEAFITEWATNTLHSPVIYEDRVITGGDYSMYGFDIHTGEQVWKTSIPGETKFASYAKTNHLIHDGRVYANGTGHDLMCLDAKTGDLIWFSTDAPNCTDNMIYYQDMLVFTSWGKGSVMVIDAITGDLIHRQGAYDDSIFNNDVVYDEETDMFFTSTYKHAMGFRINKPD